MVNYEKIVDKLYQLKSRFNIWEGDFITTMYRERPNGYLHMGFTYSKEGRKSRVKKTLMPVFCPFCGNRY